MGIVVDKKYGGSEADSLALSVAVEEISRYWRGPFSGGYLKNWCLLKRTETNNHILNMKLFLQLKYYLHNLIFLKKETHILSYF